MKKMLSTVLVCLAFAVAARAQFTMPYATGAKTGSTPSGILPVGKPTCTYATSGNSITVSYTAVAAGDTLILSIQTEPATSVTSLITDSASSSYTHPTTASVGSAQTEDIWGALSLNPGATNPIITLSGTVTAATVCVQEWSGVPHFGATSTPTAPLGNTYNFSFTTTGANSIVILGVVQGNSGTWTCTTGTQAIYLSGAPSPGISQAVQYNSGSTSGSSVTIAGDAPTNATNRAVLLELKSQ